MWRSRSRWRASLRRLGHGPRPRPSEHRLAGRTRLVEATHLAENGFVGAPTGILDQSASLLSVEGAALFLDCRDASSSPVDLGLDAAGLAVLVIDTKVKHEHVSGGYAARRAACERAARDLGVRALRDVTVPQLLAARAQLDEETFRRARHVVTEDQRVLDTVKALRAGDHTATARKFGQARQGELCFRE